MIRRLVMSIVFASIMWAAGGAAEVDFDTQIIPVLTKLGCNAGACHGAAAGRGNFHLSLLGADPVADFETIVYAYQGRRVDLVHPDRSLMLAKPTGGLEHGGDIVMSDDSPEAQRLRSWIESGARRNQLRTLIRFEVTPARQILSIDDALPDPTRPAGVADVKDSLDPINSAPLRAIASFDNGDREEVTNWVTFTSPDPEAARWDADRRAVVVRRRGAHVVLARFLDRVMPVEIIVPLGNAPVDLSDEPRANFIDEWVLRTLTRLSLPASPLSDDAEFLRRVFLDLIGRLPEPDEVHRFFQDDSLDKRQRQIDALLSSESFVDYWTFRFARWLDLHSLPNDTLCAERYGQWIHSELTRGDSVKELARQLLIATGDTHDVGPANFTRMAADPRAQAERVGQFYMGARMGCANCHNHPLDRWTQDDYHGMAAVFARLDRGRVVRVLSRGAVTNVRTNEPAVPRIPGERDLSREEDHREELADWLLSDERGSFARVMVNRLWQALFGRGLVDPTDDLRATNPCSHPELLDALAQDWIAHDYKLRHLLRRIVTSQTYQRSHAVNGMNQLDDRFYSHAMRRALPAEILADAISDVTGVPASYGDQGADRRAVHLLDSQQAAPQLDLLGRCTRANGCDEAQQSKLGLAARLHLLNGDLINGRLASSAGRLHHMIQADASTEAIVGEFYLRALTRFPTPEETAGWLARIDADDADERIRRLEDFVWSLLNSQSFASNQ